MSVLFLVVVYDNHAQVQSFLSDMVDKTRGSGLELKFAICDNSPYPMRLDDASIAAWTWRPDNPGYLEGALLAWEEYLTNSGAEPAWVFLSNTDLSLVEDLAGPLAALGQLADTPCLIAPRITEGPQEQEMNPHLLVRRSNNRLRLNALLTRTAWLAQGYIAASGLRERVGLRRSRTPRQGEFEEMTLMYSPYGAIVGASRAFMASVRLPRNAPLYSEEYVLAEAAIQHHAPVYYTPSLHFHHDGHVATGRLPSLRNAALYSRAFAYIKDSRNAVLPS